MEKLSHWVTLLCFVGTTAIAAPHQDPSPGSKLDTPLLLGKVVRQIESHKTVDQLVRQVVRGLPEEASSFIQLKARPFLTARTPKISARGSEFTVIAPVNAPANSKDANPVSFSIKVLDFDQGQFTINHQVVSLSVKDLEHSWSSIEKTLPTFARSPILDLVLPSAHADFFTATAIVLVVVAVYLMGNDLWANAQLHQGLKDCQKATQSSSFRTGPKDQAERDQIKKTLTAISAFQSYSRFCKKTSPDYREMCANEKRYGACLARLQEKLSTFTNPEGDATRPPDLSGRGASPGL